MTTTWATALAGATKPEGSRLCFTQFATQKAPAHNPGRFARQAHIPPWPVGCNRIVIGTANTSLFT